MGFVLFKKQRLQKAELNFNLGKSKLALKLAKPLLDTKDKAIAHSANRISGLVRYKQKKYQESLPYLERACQLGNYKHDWYNYAISLAYSGDSEKSEAAFQNIYRTNVQPGYLYAVPVAILLFQYVKALKDKGFNTLAKQRANELKQMYASVGVLNDLNETSRGLPAYHRFRELVSGLYENEDYAEWEKKNIKFE